MAEIKDKTNVEQTTVPAAAPPVRAPDKAAIEKAKNAEKERARKEAEAQAKADRKLLQKEYVNPHMYAFGKTAGLVAIVGTLLTAAYYFAFGVLDNKRKSVLVKPLEGWEILKNYFKHRSEKLTFKQLFEMSKINPEEIHGHSKFIVASSIGAIAAKLMTIPAYVKYVHEADGINIKTAARIRRMQEQEKEIKGLQAQLDERDTVEEKPETKFAVRKDIKSKASESFVEKTAPSLEPAAERAL